MNAEPGVGLRAPPALPVLPGECPSFVLVEMLPGTSECSLDTHRGHHVALFTIDCQGLGVLSVL